MNKLYWGNGECSLEGSQIKGLELNGTFLMEMTKTAGNDILIMPNNSKVLIVSIGESYLNDLFTYTGSINIKSIIAVDGNGERVPCKVHRVMDYSELIYSNAEDMTIKSENMDVGHTKGSIVAKTTVDVKAVENLHTEGRYYLSDGSPYSGSFHIHLADSGAMTGTKHDESSQDLYIKQNINGKVIDRLIPTKNPAKRLLGKKIQGQEYKIKRTRKTNRLRGNGRTDGGTGSGSGY